MGISCAEVEGWQPIETAPKDGTRILLWPHYGSIVMGQWHETTLRTKGRWLIIGSFIVCPSPTHWMPLPQPPAETQETK